jgi:hypothetical protein
MSGEPNPFYDAHETSLSHLSDHDWNVLKSRWHKGVDWYVHKTGSRWTIIEAIGKFPLFRTKRHACQVADDLMLAESHWRSHQQWEADHSAQRSA